MVAGCIDWQKNGLAPPTVVTEATEKYLAEEDVLQTWFGECCVRDPKQTMKSSDLYANWRRWAEARNEFVGSNKEFTRHMTDLGFELKPMRDGNRWLGIGLAPL